MKWITTLKENNANYPLDRKFNEFNKEYFDEKLTNYNVKWTAATSAAGGRYYSDGETIELSTYVANIVKKEYLEEVFDYILLHEMAHAYVYEVFGDVKRAHGKEFRSVFLPVVDAAGLAHLNHRGKVTQIIIPLEYYTKDYIDKEKQKQQKKKDKPSIG